MTWTSESWRVNAIERARRPNRRREWAYLAVLMTGTFWAGPAFAGDAIYTTTKEGTAVGTAARNERDRLVQLNRGAAPGAKPPASAQNPTPH